MAESQQQQIDRGGRVLYVGTFSKTLLRALRIGFLVLPAELVDLFRTAKWLSEGSKPSIAIWRLSLRAITTARPAFISCCGFRICPPG